MFTIFKYELNELMPFSIIEAPIIKPLKVDYQNGKPFLWAVVNTGAREQKIKVYRIGTGNVIGSDTMLARYLNTTVSQSEPYVWHWFWNED